MCACVGVRMRACVHVPAYPRARVPACQRGCASERLRICALLLCACAPVRLRTGRLAGGQAGGWVGVGVGVGLGVGGGLGVCVLW